MENPNPADDPTNPPEPMPHRDPDPQVTPLDPDEHIKDGGIEIDEK